MSLARQITQQRGGRWCGSYGLIPTPGHSHKDRGTAVHDDGKGGVIVNPFNGDWKNVRAALELTGAQSTLNPKELVRLRRERQASIDEHRRTQTAKARKLALSGELIATGDACWRYLRLRRIREPQIDSAVRHGSLKRLPDFYGHVALLSIATNDHGDICAVQATRLLQTGEKKFGAPRLTYGSLQGSAVRLAPVGEVLAIAEGVETALSFMSLHGVPTWACLGTSNLKQFNPPRGVKRLIVAADGDRPGLEAAEAVMARLKCRSRVQIAPAPEGQDWNDVLRGGAYDAR